MSIVEHSFKSSKIPIVSYIKNLSYKDREYFIDNKIKNQFIQTVEHFKNSFIRIA